jgi:hypothetical protein
MQCILFKLNEILKMANNILTTLILAFLCSFLYGLGYFLIAPLSQKVPGPLISIFQGLFLAMSNMVAIHYMDLYHHFPTLYQSNNILLLLGFVISCTLANAVGFTGMRNAGSNSGIFSVIVGLNPICMILMQVLFTNTFVEVDAMGNNNLKFNWIYYMIGTAFSTLGAIFLYLAKTG